MNRGIINSDINSFVNVNNNDLLIEFVKNYSEIGDSKIYGGKLAGSDAEKKGATAICELLKDIGLKNVEMIPVKSLKYQFNDAILRVVGESTENEIKPYGYMSPPTEEEGIDAIIIDAGLSNKDIYKDLDIKNKIVLIEAIGVLEGASLSCQVMQAEQEGALAVLVNATEDVLNEDTIRVQPLNYTAKIPVVGISTKDAMLVKEGIKKNPNQKYHLLVNSEFLPEDGVSYAVVGEIVGEVDERILFTSHLDHYFKCLQDNMSSSATLIGMARGMIKSGYKPNRTMTFVFNSSHEVGLADSRYPYIAGSYRLIDDQKKEWIGKTIVDFNFESAALDLSELRTFGSYEMASQFEEFYKFLPEKVLNGYKKIGNKASSTDYYLLAWADSISYIAKGIPVIMNDAITEQIYEGTSPYLGRDHSNHDDWDSFCEEVLNLNWQIFGSYAIYMDRLPLVQFDFNTRANTIIDKDDLNCFEKYHINSDRTICLVEDFKKKGSALYDAILKFNDSAEVNSRSVEINRELLSVNRSIVDIFDKINSQDFLIVGHRKYASNIAIFDEAINALCGGDKDKAISVLKTIDIVPLSIFFSEKIVKHTKDRINSPDYKHTRLWALGRELSSIALYEEINCLVEDCTAEQIDIVIQKLREVRDSEKANLIEILKEETDCLEKINISLDGLINKIGANDGRK